MSHIVCPCCGATVRLTVYGTQTSPVDWTKTDWRKTNRQIAEETGRFVKYVELMRRRVAKGTVRPRQKYNWKEIDWTRRTSEIAKELGVGDEYVSKMRKKFQNFEQ
jgi:hypothetical protein